MTNTSHNDNATTAITDYEQVNNRQPYLMSTEHVEHMASAITKASESALSQLVAARDSRYRNEIDPLEREADLLSREYDSMEEAIASIEAVLPSEERLTQHEADEILLSGRKDSKEAAAAKLAELEEFKRKPVAMAERQKEIVARLEAIGKEKRDIAKQVFEEWFAKVQPVVRAAEHGLFIVLLNGLEQSCYKYQERTDTGRSAYGALPYVRPLLFPERLTSLTADERSEEWRSGVRWYGGR
jgi:hypothetical protein